MTEKDLTLRMEHATQALTQKLTQSHPGLALGAFPAGLAHLILSAADEEKAFFAARDGIRKTGQFVYDHDVRALVKLAREAADRPLTSAEEAEEERERGRGLVITPEGDLKYRPVEQAIAEHLEDNMKGDPMNPNEPLDLTMLVDGKEVKPFEGIEPGPPLPTYAEQGLDPHEASEADARVAFREHEPLGDFPMPSVQLDAATVEACIERAEMVGSRFHRNHEPIEENGADAVVSALQPLLAHAKRDALVPPNDPRFRIGDLVALTKPQKGESVTLPVDLQGEVVEGSYGGYVAVDFNGSRWGVPWHELRLVESAWDRQRNWVDPDEAMRKMEKLAADLRATNRPLGPEFIGGGTPFHHGDLLKLTSGARRDELLAEGEALDSLGSFFGESRDGDDDVTYRARLREKLKGPMTPSVKDLREALSEANEVLRSTHHIAMREGMETNWGGFLQRVQDVLANQHALLVKDHDRWCRGGPEEKPCRPGDPPKKVGSCPCHPPDAIAHVVALLREAERRALSEAARLDEQRKGPRTRSIEWDVAKDLDLIARSARALASQADGLRRPPVSPPPGPPSTAPPTTREPGSHPLIMDDVVRSSAPAGALGATVEIPPGRAFINGKPVVDVASVVAEHKKTCDLHVASGSNRHRASSYDVVACALKDALIEVDKLTKTKREAEARAAEQVKLFDEAVGRVDVAKTALERIVGEATGRVEPEKPTYREAVVNVRFPQDLDHTPEEAKVLYDPDLKMGDRLRNVGQWLYVRRLPSDTAPDTIGRDGIFVRWGRLDG